MPLAVEFGKKYVTIGFDTSDHKITSYRELHDPTGEVSKEAFAASRHLRVTTNPNHLAKADFIVVAVPTPVDEARLPDFTPLLRASTTVGQNMKTGATVIYESTVYPGATEEICIPILERESGLKWKQDFHVGYSPERVNPGDRERTIVDIVKVVAGDDRETLKAVGDLYESIISAGVYRASSIKVAEAAKVIENTQRDLNIALVNELAIIFEKIGIDTLEVLEAAGTKWNFLPFRPGLVGGHCIGVDPYYLTRKAEMLGHHPQVILAGRRINDGMAAWLAQQVVKQMIAAGSPIKSAQVNVLGLTFKENVCDTRNSKVADLVRELQDYGCDVRVHDPVADALETRHQHGISLSSWNDLPQADALIAAVPHHQYLSMPLQEILVKLKPTGIFVDVKSMYSKDELLTKGFRVWRL